jgi:hypothetical protein
MQFVNVGQAQKTILSAALPIYQRQNHAGQIGMAVVEYCMGGYVDDAEPVQIGAVKGRGRSIEIEQRPR